MCVCVCVCNNLSDSRVSRRLSGGRNVTLALAFFRSTYLLTYSHVDAVPGKAGHIERLGKGLDFSLQRRDFFASVDAFLPVYQFLTVRFLRFQTDFRGFVQEYGDLFEILLHQTATGHSGRANAASTRGQSARVAKHPRSCST